MTCEDHGPGSLRDALDGANSGDSIDLSRLACSTITLTTGELRTYRDDITLQGSVTISATGNSRVLNHLGNGTLNIFGVTLADGRHVTDWATAGGCLYTRGDLFAIGMTVKNCVASSRPGIWGMVLGGGAFIGGNAALLDTVIIGNTIVSENDADIARGGGIYAYRMTLMRGTISGNAVESKWPDASSVKAGGGFYSRSHVYIAYSTISGNSADLGGGGRQSGSIPSSNEHPVSTIKNSTISGNTARLGAAGIVSSDDLLKLWNDTIAFNVVGTLGASTTTACGGILAFGGDEYLSLRSSIIADNRVNADAADVCTMPHTAPIVGYGNLVIAANQPLPPDTIQADPMLAPLAYNGGSTQTHALLPGSPALDTGNNSTSLTHDQRGFPRVIGARADIGAYEVQPDSIFEDDFD